MWSMNMTNPTSCLKESHRNRYYVYVLPGTQRHWTLSLRQNWAHLCREIQASCRSPACSGCSWPSPSLVGMLPNVGARVQGERTAHRCVELHRDLGRKGGLGKSKRLRISIWVINIWVSPKLISALFCSLFQLCFLTFSTGSCVSQKVTQDQSDIISQVGQ